MKVLFSSRPSYGHFYPLVPLAQACARAEHEVMFATGQDFVPLAENLGFAAVEAGPSILWGETKTIEEHPELGNLPPDRKMDLGVTMFGETLAEAVADALIPILQEARPDLVIFEATDIGAVVAATVAGIPAVHHSWGRIPAHFMVGLAQRLSKQWDKRGISVDAPFSGIAGRAYLDICPPSLQDPIISRISNVIPVRSVAWAPDSPLPSALDRKRTRPLVYVTLGTVVFEATEALNAALDGLEMLDVDVLVTVGPAGDPASVGSRPERFQIERFVPQHRVLPLVDAVLSHCGSGTMLASCALGLPQLAIPQGADQFANAEALTASGAGKMLHPGETSASAVASSMKELLHGDGYAAAAKRIASEMAATPSPGDVVPELVKAASGS